MEDLITTIITIAIAVGLSVIQSAANKKKKKEHEANHPVDDEVLDSPFPDVEYSDDYNEPEEMVYEFPEQSTYKPEPVQQATKQPETEKEKKLTDVIGETIFESIFGKQETKEDKTTQESQNKPLEVKPLQATTLEYNNHDNKYNKYDSANKKQNFKPKAKTDQTEQKNSEVDIDFSDPNEVRRAFVASLIFEKKY